MKFVSPMFSQTLNKILGLILLKIAESCDMVWS